MMDFEDLIYEEFEAGLRERTSLTQKLRMTEDELEEIRLREEEEPRQKEDALGKLEEAVETLVAAGIPREQARKQLGLD